MSPVHSQYLGVSLNDGRRVSDDSVGLRCEWEGLLDVVMRGVSERVRVITVLGDGEWAAVAVNEVLAEPLALEEHDALKVAVSEIVLDNVSDTERDSNIDQLEDTDADVLVVNDTVLDRKSEGVPVVGTVDDNEAVFDDDETVRLGEELNEVV
jgi:hypothetical protein